MRALLFLLIFGFSAPLAMAKPRVVSLDYCADQFVLGLADRAQVLAVSRDAGAPFSHFRARAEGLPTVRTASEDVLALKPDVVLRSWGGDARALAFYQRHGIVTVQIGYAEDLAGTLAVTRAAAKALDQEARAETLIAALPQPQALKNKRAMYLTPGGYTAGKGTLLDALMTAAGLSNASAQTGWTSYALESLVLNPPQFVLTGFFGFDADANDAWSLGRHPVMRRTLRTAQTLPLDESRLTCPAWFVAEEAAAIARAVEAMP
jgi:iron complex transport system substrate-binding protein